MNLGITNIVLFQKKFQGLAIRINMLLMPPEMLPRLLAGAPVTFERKALPIPSGVEARALGTHSDGERLDIQSGSYHCFNHYFVKCPVGQWNNLERKSLSSFSYFFSFL